MAQRDEPNSLFGEPAWMPAGVTDEMISEISQGPAGVTAEMTAALQCTDTEIGFAVLTPKAFKRLAVHAISEWNEANSAELLDHHLSKLFFMLERSCSMRGIDWSREHTVLVLAEARLEIASTHENDEALRARARTMNRGLMRCTEPNESLEDCIERISLALGVERITCKECDCLLMWKRK